MAFVCNACGQRKRNMAKDYYGVCDDCESEYLDSWSALRSQEIARGLPRHTLTYRPTYWAERFNAIQTTNASTKAKVSVA